MEKNRRPNWEKWRHIPRLKLWEAAALTLDIDPDKVKHDPNAWMADSIYGMYDEGEVFKDRLVILRRNAKLSGSKLRVANYLINRPDNTEVSLGAVATFAKIAQWSLPADFPDSLESEVPALIDKDYWRNRDAWSEAELVDLLCGLDPGSRRASTELTSLALEDVRRAVMTSQLPALLPSDATDGDGFYGHHRFFLPKDAIVWATRTPGRFPLFPFLLESISSPADGENPLETRERKSLLLIIAALAAEAKLDLGKPSKAAAAIESMIERAGGTLSVRAIETHLKRASEAVSALSGE